MKKIFGFGFLFLMATSVVTSCKKNDTSGSGSGNTTDSLHVVLSSSTVENNGFDYVNISVKDQNGNDITSSSELYANGNYTGSKFVPSGTGTYIITAKKGTIPSDSKTLNATSPSASPFSQKILVEDCTGAWCGYCPRLANSLDNYKSTHPNAIVLAIHGGGGTDPFKYQYYTSINSAFAVSGYPTAIVNRAFKWSESTSDLTAQFNKWAPLGLSIESSDNGTAVTGKVKVKFNVTTDQSMKIVVALVENGLVYPQTNYYDGSSPQYSPALYGGVHSITGFLHNNVLRRAATDIFGDAIPTTSQVKNGVYELPFSIPLAGSTSSGSYTAVAANSAIVAYVLDGSASKKGIYNVQYATVGSVKNFD